MLTKKLPQGDLVLYESIKELPSRRHNLLNKFIAQDNGVGADLDAVASHYAKFDMHLAAGDLDALKLERANLHYCYNAMFQNFDMKTRPLLCFAFSIDGHVVGSLDSDTEIETCYDLLDKIGCTYGDISEYYEMIKKKWMLS